MHLATDQDEESKRMKGIERKGKQEERRTREQVGKRSNSSSAALEREPSKRAADLSLPHLVQVFSRNGALIPRFCFFLALILRYVFFPGTGSTTEEVSSIY